MAAESSIKDLKLRLKMISLLLEMEMFRLFSISLVQRTLCRIKFRNEEEVVTTVRGVRMSAMRRRVVRKPREGIMML